MLKSLRLTVLALSALMAVGVITAANASAVLPKFEKFGECEQEVGIKQYLYTNSTCTTESSTMEGEWGLTPFLSTSGESVLETVKGLVIKCTDDENWGEILTEQTDRVLIVFLGCVDETGASCENTTTAGVIALPELESLLGYITRSPLDVGVLLTAIGGGNFLVEFECLRLFTIKVDVTGSVIGLITTCNTLTKNYTLAFEQTAGVQAITKFEGEATEHKLSTTIAGVTEGSGELSTDSITTLLENKLLC